MLNYPADKLGSFVVGQRRHFRLRSLAFSGWPHSGVSYDVRKPTLPPAGESVCMRATEAARSDSKRAAGHAASLHVRGNAPNA